MEALEILDLLTVAGKASAKITALEGYNCNVILKDEGVQVSLGFVDATKRLHTSWSFIGWKDIVEFKGNLIVKNINDCYKLLEDKKEQARQEAQMARLKSGKGLLMQ